MWMDPPSLRCKANTDLRRAVLLSSGIAQQEQREHTYATQYRSQDHTRQETSCLIVDALEQEKDPAFNGVLEAEL